MLAWYIRRKDAPASDKPLGAVLFYPRWRRYVFQPYSNTLYEHDCLRDIADFCEAQTRAWREGIKARKTKEPK